MAWRLGLVFPNPIFTLVCCLCPLIFLNRSLPLSPKQCVHNLPLQGSGGAGLIYLGFFEASCYLLNTSCCEFSFQMSSFPDLVMAAFRFRGFRRCCWEVFLLKKRMENFASGRLESLALYSDFRNGWRFEKSMGTWEPVTNIYSTQDQQMSLFLLVPTLDNSWVLEVPPHTIYTRYRGQHARVYDQGLSTPAHNRVWFYVALADLELDM